MNDWRIKMAVSKAIEFTKTENRISDWAKALSHPARIKILKILAQKNICMCGDIVDLMPLAQATVSQHLKELKRVGFIKGEIEGPKICYCLDYHVINEAQKKLKEFFEGIIK
jgi:ArsR family transcriptional regulator